MSVASSKRGHSAMAAAAAAAADPQRRVHPRHFHAADACSAERASSSSSSSASAVTVAHKSFLHRHALESIFAFCSLKEMGSVISVCKDWLAALISVSPRNFTLQLTRRATSHWLLHMCRSRLAARHIGRLMGDDDCMPFSAEHIYFVACSLKSLRTMSVLLEASTVPVQFPPQLQNLTLYLPDRYFQAAANTVLDAVGHLHDLTTLTIVQLVDDDIIFSFGPLANCPALSSLILSRGLGEFSPEQVQQLRTLHSLRRLVTSGMSCLSFTALLAPGHQLQQLDSLECEGGPPEDYDALAQLPSLTRLACVVMTPHVDFLPRIRQLRSLDFRFEFDMVLTANVVQVMSALTACEQLTELSVCHGTEFQFSSDQLAVALESMHHLRSLTVLGEKGRAGVQGVQPLSSLSFLEAGTLNKTLTELNLRYCYAEFPLEELRRTHKLRALQTLRIDARTTFKPAPSQSTQWFYTPPNCLHIPSLKHIQFY